MIFEFWDRGCSERTIVLGDTWPNINTYPKKTKIFLTSISDDNIKLTRFLLDILGSSLVIFFIPWVELYSVDIGVFGGEVFEGLGRRVAGTCEDDGVGAFGDSGGEAETDTAVSTGDYITQLGREGKGMGGTYSGRRFW